MSDDFFSKVVGGFIVTIALILVMALVVTIFFPADHSKQHPCGTETYYVQVGKVLMPEQEIVWCYGTPVPSQEQR